MGLNFVQNALGSARFALTLPYLTLPLKPYLNAENVPGQ